jgi:hypothetical protein
MPQLNDLLFLFSGQRRDWLSEPLNNALLLAPLLIAAFFLPRARLARLRPLENLLLRLARRERAAIASTGVLALVVNAAISLCGRVPVPMVHDEFSYLLAADTFAHGRLSNPTPPVWIPFETFHVIFQPTYASKYPPGQGLMLSVGQVLTGHPFVGSWLGTAFACMALCWMLYRWLPPRWALLGGWLAVFHPAVIYWTQSYWGCQWVIAGSALALGGLRVFLARQQESTSGFLRCGWVSGLGMGLMLLTRPYEGGVLSLFILGVLALAALRARRLFARQLAPLFGCLLLTVLAQGFYNSRVTGDARVLPYVVHEKAYGVSPLLVWQHFKPEPHYNHRVLRQSHVFEEAPQYVRTPSAHLWLIVLQDKLMRFALLHCQLIASALALSALPWIVRRNRWMQLAFGLTLLMIGAILVEVWLLPHYTTALVPLGLVLSVSGLRAVRSWRWHGRHCGLFLMRATVILSFLSVVSSYAQLADPQSEGIVYSSPGSRQFAAARQSLLEKLSVRPGRHLVIVRYRPEHNNTQEWVFNAADIMNAKVAWARAMNPRQDRELADYFRQRDHAIWLLDADAKPPHLKPFVF